MSLLYEGIWILSSIINPSFVSDSVKKVSEIVVPNIELIFLMSISRYFC